MTRRKPTRGNCIFCGKDYTRWGMTRHLKSCAERASAIESDAMGPGPRQKIFHLLVDDPWSTDYWLHLEIAGQSTFDQLDQYLRFIWLECCGHLSHFLITGSTMIERLTWSGQSANLSRWTQRSPTHLNREQRQNTSMTSGPQPT